MAVLTALLKGLDGAGDEPLVGVPFCAGAQVNLNRTAAPASPRQPPRDSTSGWKSCLPLGSIRCASVPLQTTLSSSRRRCNLPVGSLLYGVLFKSGGVRG